MKHTCSECGESFTCKEDCVSIVEITSGCLCDRCYIRYLVNLYNEYLHCNYDNIKNEILIKVINRDCMTSNLDLSKLDTIIIADSI